MASETSGNAKMDFKTFYNVIDGKLEPTVKTRHTINPSTLEANPEAPLSTSDEVDKAVKIAHEAAKEWAAVPWDERKNALANFAAALEAQLEDFAQMLVWEHGKPILWARHELATDIGFLKGFCELSLPEETIEDAPDRKIVKSYVPLGVAVGIVPWNYPVHLAGAKLGPALLTGNAFILKPSPFTPYSGLKLAELGMQFFPPGVLQALSGGDDLGPLLTTHPLVNMVSFTGSVPTGKAVMKSCSDTLKRVTLELGGNDAAIVCADVDPVVAATKIALFAFCNSGQICMSIKRVYVHESIYDQFLDALVKHVQALPFGVGETAFIGPVANELHFKRVQKIIADINDAKFAVAAGGAESVPGQKGYYLPPTIIDNPPESSAIVQEEQFGPVLPLLKWSDESDVVQRVNGTDSGLGASVWTRDDEQAVRVANQLEAGSVWINTHAEIVASTPFAGHKQSGLGVEWGVDGLKSYCNTKAVYRRAF
ncbi:hypothetical protein PFICI_12718 [Pestalotiopsis fici W106-1]|uniref:aldehyde dehydrogenase (NAD(+)) n=1 Tax=Pestalotiopsis fici (strain W106-1 / CGMCC3.15140) TaxID=1229662 RepID=W3WPR1_PESFW|nr:uncharacterized protein PFICI_12718 [Pestalotiopsis fici W106-1]ETS75774.1 hypothetical protein PFICI_12718 [Pestalotiopsis fici W106-1]